MWGGHRLKIGCYSFLSNLGDNTFVGEQAGPGKTISTVGQNTGIGELALGNLASYSPGNIALGYQAGVNLTQGADNIYIGNQGVSSENNSIRIGNTREHSRVFIIPIRGITTGNADAIPVLIDSNGQLGTVSSSRRYKFDISEMGDKTDGLMRLRPVTFRYLAHGDHAPLQYGLIAEEVAETYPELVVRDGNGQPDTVMYQFLAPMLLNEVQRQHRTIEDQSRTIEQQSKDLDTLSKALMDVESRLRELEKRTLQN